MKNEQNRVPSYIRSRVRVTFGFIVSRWSAHSLGWAISRCFLKEKKLEYLHSRCNLGVSRWSSKQAWIGVSQHFPQLRQDIDIRARIPEKVAICNVIWSDFTSCVSLSDCEWENTFQCDRHYQIKYIPKKSW